MTINNILFLSIILFQFVQRHFHVDDRLVSVPTDPAVMDLLKCICASLAESNLKLHAIASNSTAVMRAFEHEEMATHIRDLGLDDETCSEESRIMLGHQHRYVHLQGSHHQQAFHPS